MVLNRAYLRVQQHSSLLAGHIWAGDGCPPTLHDGQLNILLQTLEREKQHASISLDVQWNRENCTTIHHECLALVKSNIFNYISQYILSLLSTVSENNTKHIKTWLRTNAFLTKKAERKKSCCENRANQIPQKHELPISIHASKVTCCLSHEIWKGRRKTKQTLRKGRQFWGTENKNICHFSVENIKQI